MLDIAVVIPTHNRITFIERAIDSVLNQSFTVNEIIIVDDGSNDGTKELIKTKYPEINYFYQPNKGVSAARNKAAYETSCSWISFLDSDDTWEPSKIEKQIEKFRIREIKELIKKNKIGRVQQIHCEYPMEGFIRNFASSGEVSSPQKWRLRDRIAKIYDKELKHLVTIQKYHKNEKRSYTLL